MFIRVLLLAKKSYFRNQHLTIAHQRQKQLLEGFYKKGVLKNFANFTGKHLYRNLFLIKMKAA